MTLSNIDIQMITIADIMLVALIAGLMIPVIKRGRAKIIKIKEFLKLAGLAILAAGVCIAFMSGLKYLGLINTNVTGMDTTDLNLILANPILATLTVSIIPAFLEEIIFRFGIIGIVKKFLGKRKNFEFWAVIISAVPFALAHGETYQRIYALIFGAVLAKIYMKDYNIIRNVVFHGAFNFTNILVLYAAMGIEKYLHI